MSRAPLLRVALLALVVAGVADLSPAVAQDGVTTQLDSAPPIFRVEEDWEILIEDPDPNLDIPQIVTVFGPSDAAFGTHTVFELNHGTLPDFGEGGMQLQVWWQDALVGYRRQRSPTELYVSNEVIRFTTVTALKNHILEMAVINGVSETFGEFGNTGGLTLQLYSSRDNLNPYDPENSIRYSRVTFGANRVRYFKRAAIRFYAEDGLYLSDTTPQYVHGKELSSGL